MKQLIWIKKIGTAAQIFVAGTKETTSNIKDFAISAGLIYIIYIIIFKQASINNFLDRFKIDNIKGDIAGMKLEFSREKNNDLQTSANFVQIKNTFDYLQDTYKQLSETKDTAKVRELTANMGNYIIQVHNLLNKTDKELKKDIIDHEDKGKQEFKIEPEQVGWVYLGICNPNKKWNSSSQNVKQAFGEIQSWKAIDIITDVFLRDPNSIKGEYSKQSPISVIKTGEKLNIISIELVSLINGNSSVWAKVSRIKSN